MIKILVTEKLHDAVRAAAAITGDTVSTWGKRLFEREVAQAISIGVQRDNAVDGVGRRGRARGKTR